MANKLTVLAAVLLLFVSSCDLNDTKDDNGTYFLFLKAKINGTDWSATSAGVGASPDNSGASPLVRIHGDLAGTNEYFILKFPSMTGSDTSIVGTGLAGVIEFHETYPDTWITTTGSLTIHKAGTVTHHEYTGTFSGTFQHVLNSTTISVTNGEYRAQGIF